MIEQLCYRFTSRQKLLEKRIQQALPTTDDIREANSKIVDRMKKELDLREDSTIADLRIAVQKLAD